MEKTKLTLRIEKPIIEAAKDYAEQHNTSLSRLVAEFLRSLRSSAGQSPPPILAELSGILPADVSLQEHRDYYQEHAEPEDEILIESGILPQLIASASQQPPAIDWERELCR